VNDLGKVLIVLGAVIVLAGVVLLVAPRVPWLGRLPGDIHVERGRWSVHVPLATSLLLSVLLTLILSLFGRR
jgi:hypothetical protein